MRSVVLAALLPALACPGAWADEVGLAVYYENPHHPGLIAAHRTLPFGTRVRVHNLENGRDVVVTIVDRGPHVAGRIIDVSTLAAGALGMLRAGVARVRLEIVDTRQRTDAKCPAFAPRRCESLADAERGPR